MIHFSPDTAYNNVPDLQLIKVLVSEANDLNAASPWGTSSTAELLLEITKRYCKKINNENIL